MAARSAFELLGGVDFHAYKARRRRQLGRWGVSALHEFCGP